MAEAAAQTLHNLRADQSCEGDPTGTPATQAAQPGASGPLPTDDAAGAAGADQGLTPRQLSARSIKPGSDLAVESVKHWKGGSLSKLGLADLREEVSR